MNPEDTSRATIPMFDLSRKIEKHSKDLERIFSQVLESGNVILGDQVQAFEHEFSTYLGAKHCISVANGTDAIEIAIKSLSLPRGSKIVTVANAGGYSSTAIKSAGYIPVYIDVNLTTGLVDFELLREFDLNNVSAVVLTHLFGNPIGEIDQIIEYLKKIGVRTIEDCAQAHGAKVSGRFVGTFADVSAFSFYPTKNLGALGDGGALITNDGGIFAIAKSLRTYGWGTKYDVALSGGQNSRLDEIQAAFLRLFLNSLEENNEIRRRIVARYSESFSESYFSRFATAENVTHAHHLYVLKTSYRSELADHLTSQGVSYAVHYPNLDYDQVGFDAKSEKLLNSETLKSSIISLPLFPELCENEVQTVIEALGNFYPKSFKKD